MLGGGSKSFKTWTLSELAICVATGRPWLGFETTRGEVLYLNFELPAFSFEQRGRAICQAMGIAVPSNLDVLAAALLNARHQAVRMQQPQRIGDDFFRAGVSHGYFICPSSLRALSVC